ADEPANKDYEPHLIADKDRAGQYGINPAIKPVRAARTKSSPEKETQTSGVVSFGKEKLIFSGLNPQQREAVQNTDSALIIVAGPGTGKTRTLSHRIAYLIDQVGVSPESILAITFTNKAAREMNDRLSKLLSPQQSKGICVQTFHAFGMWLLRQEGERFGLTPAFSVLSESNRKDLFKTIYPDFIEREVNARLEQISLAKNQLL
ncbi:UvrD-helicase domain-containing protein, partial [candidate division KSB1 bacterium]|nr:UvrD-helicase domain-containing protein [candidate division KSB1 bacterium]NIS26162.1 UvrD-helicase domain-containing protein [candidate division KSB1 bacterium]NIT72927.1 UvrD-helicase domain-containing protein [candidate division KSB1 bacterium]NIU26807.1 UvrD-helicase domain-containing protein [candidate division KSB1 bacterium]NIU92278.1 UvrD-helicase domain-containing protein [candidate division KSB1 bacterium]